MKIITKDSFKTERIMAIVRPTQRKPKAGLIKSLSVLLCRVFGHRWELVIRRELGYYSYNCTRCHTSEVYAMPGGKP